MRKSLIAFALSATALVATPALADNTVTVTSLVTPPVPATNQWGVLPGETSPDGSANLSTTNVSDTDGSLHINGDRTRVQTGYQYTPATNTGILANSLVDMTADYILNSFGTTPFGTNTAASPAFRVLIQDGTQRSELIWEAYLQVGAGGTSALGVGSMDAGDLFWQYVAGCGPTVTAGGCPGGGTYVLRTLSAWGDLYSSTAFVSALSIGSGSGAGVGFDANIDNLRLTTSIPANTSTYNFTAGVPEPATWAMMLLGFGGIGASMRRQRRAVKLAQVA